MVMYIHSRPTIRFVDADETLTTLSTGAIGGFILFKEWKKGYSIVCNACFFHCIITKLLAFIPPAAIETDICRISLLALHFLEGKKLFLFWAIFILLPLINTAAIILYPNDRPNLFYSKVPQYLMFSIFYSCSTFHSNPS